MNLYEPPLPDTIRDACQQGLSGAATYRYQRIYVIGLSDLTDGLGIGQAKHVGWQCLAKYKDELVALEVADRSDRPHPAPGAPKSASLGRGPTVKKAWEAAEYVKSLPPEERPPSQFELRTLRIPGLLIEALWLKADRGGRDRALPFLFYPQEDLQSKRLYTMEEFLSKLRPLAAKRLKRDESLND